MNYTAPERETVILSDDADNTWSICTLQQKVINKLRKAGIEPYKVTDGTHWYKDIPFNRVSFRNESKRVMSEEQRKAASDRLKTARERGNKSEN